MNKCWRFFCEYPYKAEPEEKEKESEQDSITLSSTDDLMTRAEKIVWAVGYRGAVSNYVLDIYRLLQKYEELDKKEVYNG